MCYLIRLKIVSIFHDTTSPSLLLLKKLICQLLTSHISSTSSLAYPSFNVSFLIYTMDLQFTLKSLKLTNSSSPYIYNRSFMPVKTGKHLKPYK